MAQESNQVTTTTIRAEIERTRTEMSRTIDAIHGRLSPGRLISDAKESVKDATIGRVKRLAARTSGGAGNTYRSIDAKHMVDAVNLRTNPMPFAIAGIAAMAFVARALLRSRAGSHRDFEPAATRSTEPPRALSNRFRRNTRRLFVSGCAAGLGCWGAWRARQFRTDLRSAETD